MEIVINVYDYDRKGVEKVLYRNTIQYDDSLVFPFNQLYDSFSLLYPGCMVRFSTILR